MDTLLWTLSTLTYKHRSSNGRVVAWSYFRGTLSECHSRSSRLDREERQGRSRHYSAKILFGGSSGVEKDGRGRELLTRQMSPLALGAVPGTLPGHWWVPGIFPETLILVPVFTRSISVNHHRPKNQGSNLPLDVSGGWIGVHFLESERDEDSEPQGSQT